ncbi:Ivy family c-type lysozyme inhibitor [Burkholderia singularis]|uniref:Ivy family c-type lysozyme inhibitor n=2 Tax=Burkholderia TaxID=32008 RepID=UPI000AA98F85
MPDLVTLNMRELDRLKVIQAVVDLGLKPGRAANAAFDAMKKGHRLPAWVARVGTETSANTVSFGGRDVSVTNACKPHDYSSERIAVLYDPQEDVVIRP